MDTFGATQSDDGKGSNPSSPEPEVEDTLMEDDVEPDSDADENDDKSDAEGEDDEDADGEGDDPNSPTDLPEDGATAQLQRERESSSELSLDTRWRPKIRPGAETAGSYDIIPYVAAPMSTSIHAVCATPCMKLVFTGGQDGYIRKFDWFASINGKVPLTVAQRHPFVDTVTRAGVLLSYWENEEIPDKNSLYVESDDMKISPVYSLATQRQALWLLSGLESGNINLQSVRHDEGKNIAVLRKHRSTVSVLTLGHDEKTLLSGSWDKDIHDWDLNKGEIVRTYSPQAGQLSAIQWRPQSIIPIPVERQPVMNGITSASLSKLANGLTNGLKSPKVENNADAPGSPASSGGFDSLFGGDDDADDLFGPELSNTRTAQNSSLVPTDGDDDVLMGDAQPAEQQLINENAVSAAAAEASSSTIENQASSETVGDTGLDIPDTQDSAAPQSPSQPTLDGSSTGDVSSNIFLAASIDGIVRIFDRRQESPITRLLPGRGIPPWSTSACWSVDGNFVYVGRRNGTVEEYSIHKDFQNSVRTLKFPGGSGAVSYVTPMVNGRHLVCASFDNLRIYDLKDDAKHSSVPFLIIPGHHGGVLSSVYVDPTSNYLLTMAGNRGWEGTSTEVMLGYEIFPIQ